MEWSMEDLSGFLSNPKWGQSVGKESLPDDRTFFNFGPSEYINRRFGTTKETTLERAAF